MTVRTLVTMNILVIRPDRIGDVVLSTPVFRAIRQARPDARVHALVREPMRAVLEGLDTIDELLIYDPALHRGARGIRDLATLLRARRFDAAVALQSNAGIAAATLLARIPHRVGPLSKPHSFLLYNRGLRQRRSRVEWHEAEYNLQLLEPLGIHVAPRTLFPEIALSAATRERALGWLQRHGWDEGTPWVALHPGMGGSALNWPERNYLELAQRLQRTGFRVLLTTGPAEPDMAARFPEQLVYEPGTVDQIDMLAALYERMRLVVAPSTGPLHIAAAIGTPVLGLYPNLRVQSAARWGPYVADPARAGVLVPAIDCATDPGCMASIAVEAVLLLAQTMASRAQGSTGFLPTGVLPTNEQFIPDL